jgi:hypothetical protein
MVSAVVPRESDTTSQHAAVAPERSRVVTKTLATDLLRTSMSNCGTRSATPAPVMTTARATGSRQPPRAAKMTPPALSMAQRGSHPNFKPTYITTPAALRQERFAAHSAQNPVEAAYADQTENSTTEMVHVPGDTPAVSRSRSCRAA